MSKGETYEKFRMIAEGIFNDGRMDLIDEILSPDYVEHVTTFSGWPEGIEGLRQFVQEIRRAFPDLRYTIEQLYGSLLKGIPPPLDWG